jgi:hypothetical protein
MNQRCIISPKSREDLKINLLLLIGGQGALIGKPVRETAVIFPMRTTLEFSWFPKSFSKGR